jgi:beta-galactosidase
LLLLNGVPLLVNGVNRAEFHPDHGKALPDEIVRRDLCMLKQHNFNAVRTSRCPNANVFYDLCDELGLLVIDEANIETHGMGMFGTMSLLPCDPEWQEAYLARVQAMFARDKNHVCIMGWSLGNEGGVGPTSETCADWLRAHDRSRFVQYESGEWHGDATLVMGDGRHPLSDIVCPMYTDPEGCVRLAESEQHRPVILSEYSHAMGNSNGGLHLFYHLFRSQDYPSLRGGFIWDFADQGLRVPRQPHPNSSKEWFLNGHLGYGGDFGPESGGRRMVLLQWSGTPRPYPKASHGRMPLSLVPPSKYLLEVRASSMICQD